MTNHEQQRKPPSEEYDQEVVDYWVKRSKDGSFWHTFALGLLHDVMPRYVIAELPFNPKTRLPVVSDKN